MEPRKERRVRPARRICPPDGGIVPRITPRKGTVPMKPHVLCALIKELQSHVKEIKDLDRDALLSINRRLLKIQLEVTETLEKIR